uniref:Putative alanyl-trna editing protein aarsd1-b n=1 Tax=Amblyomma americanum TaxID=6943 RepID=A0A0C9R2Z1_AMBAM
MIFACQKDSYLKNLKTTVVACNPVVEGSAQDGYEIIFDDTVLFPEGGGQPDDRGLVGDVPVLRVFRKDGKAVHIVESPIAVGAEVEMKVDWNRRYDHMQQHSGQHLITAVAEKEFGFPTTSWSLGEDVSFIELDAPKGVKAEDVQKLESLVNEKIRQCLPLTVSLYEPGSEDLKAVRTRLKLPDGEGDVIRVVSIEGVDSNTCCGTHVSNLSHLQMIKLLYTEKGKQGKTNLYFLVGNRILNYVDKTVRREKAITTLLKCGPDDHASLIEKLNKSLKLANKNSLSVLRDLAVAEAKLLKQQEPLPAFHTFHRREADAEFMAIFANELADKKVLLFLTGGDERGSGQFLISGPENIISAVGPKVCELLDGKGFLKHGKFQGKANALSKRNRVEELLKEVLTSDNKLITDQA